MIAGNAGLVTLIATFANTIRDKVDVPKITVPYLHFLFPSALLPIVNLLIIIIGSYLIYRLFTSSRFMEKLTRYIRNHLIKKEIIQRISSEDLLLETGGYGVMTLTVSSLSPIANKTLLENNLGAHDISVLVIERKKEVIPNPLPEEKIFPEDKLICFGKLENIRKEILPSK